MPRFSISTAMTAAIWVTVLGFVSPTSPASLERIALQLNGSGCLVQQAGISSVLSAVPGVRTVDFATVPDHVLVDVDSAVVSDQDLLRMVRRVLASDGNCRVTVMESCISADPRTHSAHPPAEQPAMPH